MSDRVRSDNPISLPSFDKESPLNIASRLNIIQPSSEAGSEVIFFLSAATRSKKGSGISGLSSLFFKID